MADKRRKSTSPGSEPPAPEAIKLPERWSVQRKMELVLRLLRGEPLDAVSRESQVPANELETWKRVFLEHGIRGLKSRSDLLPDFAPLRMRGSGSCPVKGELLELLGWDIAQGAVWADGIVGHAPRLDRFACLAEAHEPVLVETLIAQPAIEALDVGVLVWLAWLDEVQFDTMGVGPRVDGSANELGAVVG